MLFLSLTLLAQNRPLRGTVVDKNGEEVNKFSKVNIMTFAKYVDQHQRITVRITEGNHDSNYNSWTIIKME